MAEDRAAFAGQLGDLPVGELLRTIAAGRQTGVARFETNLGRATVWFREGSLIDADMGRFHMEAAVRRLMQVDDGTFEVEFKPISRRPLIKENTSRLLDDEVPSDSAGGPRRARRAPASWQPTGGGPPRAAPAAIPHDIAPADLIKRLEQMRRDNAAAYEDDQTVALGAGSAEADRSSGNRATVMGLPAPAAPPTPTGTEPGPATPSDEAPMGAQPGSGAADAGVGLFAPPGRARASSPARRTMSLSAATAAPLPATAARTGSTEPPASAPVGTPSIPASQIPAPPRLNLFSDPGDEDPTVMQQAPTGHDRTEAPEGDIPRARPAPHERGANAPRLTIDEDPSGPISVGMTWSAPSHVTRVPQPSARSSAQTSSLGGTIEDGQVGARTGQSDAGRTVTEGFVPAPPEQGRREDSSSGRTAAYPAVPGSDRIARQLGLRPGGRRSPRAEGIAAKIGLHGPPAPTGPAQPAPMSEGEEGAAAPAVVGRYEVMLRLARGGMGTVYLCRVTGEGGFRRLFALKVIRDHLSRNDEYVRMLLQEARLASRLHHPNVVGIVDIGQLQGQHYLVMDYVEGCTFSELLKVHAKSRPPHLIIPIVIDALTGLHAAHTLTDDDGSPLQMVHCDFSPQNMLVGTNGICRITDFGIARASDALPDRASVTRGKPAYLSPEQVMGGALDHRADVFAAGVILWNALTGEQLFGGETPSEILDRVLHRNIPPPSTVGLRPPSALDPIVLKALRRDPGQRWQSAEEMLIELRKVAITEDLLAPSSDVAKWVTQTFGSQLELRRKAAGISSKGGSMTSAGSSPSAPSIPALPALRSPSQVSVPELGLGSEETATHALVQTGSDTEPEEGASRTVMLRTAVDATGAPASLQPKYRMMVLSAMGALAAAAVALAVLRPDVIQGGFVDEYGTYLDGPPMYAEPSDAQPTTPADTKGAQTKTGDSQGAADTKAGAEIGDTKIAETAGETKAGDTKAGDTKAGDTETAADTDAAVDTDSAQVGDTEGAPAIETTEPADVGKPEPKPRRKKPKPEPKAKPTPEPEPEPKAKPTPESEPKAKPTPEPEPKDEPPPPPAPEPEPPGQEDEPEIPPPPPPPDPA